MERTTTADRLNSLTQRQREVLKLIADGRSNAEIAGVLGVSLDGAKWHVREVVTRLGVDSREEAADEWRAANGLRRKLWRKSRAFAFGLSLKWAAGGVAAVALGGAVAAGVVFVQDSAPGSADRTIIMEGRSMLPTIADGQLLAWEPYPAGSEPASGDIVVFRNPTRPDQLLVKRVVAPDADVVQVDDGRLVLDGQPVPELYLARIEQRPLSAATGHYYLVGPRQYFVMGDNRDLSLDSRHSAVGNIPRDHVLGRVLLSKREP